MYYIVAGVSVTALGYVFLILPGLPPLLLATFGVIALTIGEMMSLPFINTIVMKRANDQNKGKYAAAYALSWSIATIVGPGGGGMIIERWGYPVLWIIMICISAGCAFSFHLLSRKTGRQELAAHAKPIP
jgi:MFS family permease